LAWGLDWNQAVALLVLFEDRGLPRSRAAVRGYWKHGRTADTADDR
jgi:NADPH-dependent ferric siderophore reductase